MTGVRWILCFAGIGLQAAGVVRAFGAGHTEINLITGSLLYLLGSVPLVYVIERGVEKKGRRGVWALAALLGPIALLVPRFLSHRDPNQSASRPPRRIHRNSLDRIVGIGVTLLATAGFMWAGNQWLQRGNWPPETPTRQIPVNERLAFERVRTIIDAQEAYRERDWDGDGAKGYAQFLVHLWRSVDSEGRPVEANLIPQRLGFAMEEAWALDGYFFRDLYAREPMQPINPPGEHTDPSESSHALDPKTEWGLAALPESPGETGRLAFIADQTGKIWARETGSTARTVFPRDPAADGWIEIRSEQDLTELQRTLAKS